MHNCDLSSLRWHCINNSLSSIVNVSINIVNINAWETGLLRKTLVNHDALFSLQNQTLSAVFVWEEDRAAMCRWCTSYYVTLWKSIKLADPPSQHSNLARRRFEFLFFFFIELLRIFTENSAHSQCHSFPLQKKEKTAIIKLNMHGAHTYACATVCGTFVHFFLCKYILMIYFSIIYLFQASTANYVVPSCAKTITEQTKCTKWAQEILCWHQRKQ